MGNYYDMDGKPMEMLAWARAFEGFRHVGSTYLPNGWWVSTVWLGVDHSFPWVKESGPLIFESMVFPCPAARDRAHRGVEQVRYRTKEEARKGHDLLVKRWLKKRPASQRRDLTW